MARDAARGVGDAQPEKEPGAMKWLREELKRARALLPNWPAERWISIVALVVSGVSLLVANDVRREDRLHKRLSMQPKVVISFIHNDTGAGWLYGNSGPGPAMVRSSSVAVDEAPQRNWEAVTRLIGVTGEVSFSTLLPGLMIPQAGSSGGLLLWVHPGPGKDLLMKDFSRVRIELCYCSLYNECWLASNRLGSLLGEPCSEGKINSPFLFRERQFTPNKEDTR